MKERPRDRAPVVGLKWWGHARISAFPSAAAYTACLTDMDIIAFIHFLCPCFALHNYPCCIHPDDIPK